MHKIPDELTDLNNWCVWKFQDRNGKKTKIPYNPNTGENARSNDRSTWSSFRDSLECYKSREVDGLGFFFEPPFVGIDIDDIEDELHRFQNGDHTDNIISEFYDGFKSYAEISPSGAGIHLIIKGNIPGSRRRKQNVEMYEDGRFFTMTGHTLGKYQSVTTASSQIFKQFYDKYLHSASVTPINGNNSHGVSHNLSESEVIGEIAKSKQSGKFKILMQGNWEGHYDSQSDADMALANLLAFWCAKDYSQMDGIFRQSGLYRDKWDEKRRDSTYGEQTLFKAINETADAYTPTPMKSDSFNYIFGEAFGKKQEEKKDFSPQSWDDTGNANRFIDRYGDNYKFSYILKKFYVYDGTKWAIDDRGAIRQLIDEMIESMKKEKLVTPDDATADEIEDADKAFKDFVKKTRGTQSKKNITNELMHRRPVTPDDFDKDNMLLNVENGYLDLVSRDLYPHDINKMFSQQANTDYSDKMQPSIWMDFLNDIFDGDKEVIRYIQKALGYSLTGSTREQVMFILHGKGRNGKSIFVETISEILGDYSNNMQAKTLMVKKNDSVNTDIARLSKARFVTSSEPNEGFRFDEGLIKQITGGDKVTARFLYAEEFEYTPNFKIWVSTNHKPIITGTDDGIWRRLVLIPFDVQIPEEKVDKDLKYKLLREAPAILNWISEGAYMWMREGLKMPDKLKEASKEYRNEMDLIEQFISENFEIVDGERIKASVVYEIYKSWSKDNGLYTLSNVDFGKKMQEKFTRKRMNDGYNYFGLKIKEEYPGILSIK